MTYRWLIVWFALSLSTPVHAQDAVWKSYVEAAERAQGRKDFAEAEKQLKRALKEAKRSRENDGRLALTLHKLALLSKEQGKISKALSLWKKVLTDVKRRKGPHHAEALNTLLHMADVAIGAGKYSQAKRFLVEGLAGWERASKPDPLGKGWTLLKLGLVLQEQGQQDAAERVLRRGVTEMQKRGPDHLDLASALDHLGGLYISQGRYAQAESLFRRALKIQEKQKAPQRRYSLRRLARIAYELGDYTQAANLQRAALKLIDQEDGTRSLLAAQGLVLQGRILHAEGKLKAARKRYEQALSTLTQLDRALPTSEISPELYLTDLELDRGQLVLARKRLDRSEKILINQGSKGSHKASLGMRQARLALLRGDLKTAKTLYARCLALRQRRLPSSHPLIGRTLLELARVHLAADQPAKGAQLLKRARANISASRGKEHPELARVAYLQAEEALARGKPVEAGGLVAVARGIQRARLEAGHPVLAEGHLVAGRRALMLKDVKGARAAFTSARDLIERALDPAHIDLARCDRGLARAAVLTGKAEEAERLFQQALVRQQKSLPPGHYELTRTITVYAAFLRATGQSKRATSLEAGASRVPKKQ